MLNANTPQTQMYQLPLPPAAPTAPKQVDCSAIAQALQAVLPALTQQAGVQIQAEDVLLALRLRATAQRQKTPVDAAASASAQPPNPIAHEVSNESPPMPSLCTSDAPSHSALSTSSGLDHPKTPEQALLVQKQKPPVTLADIAKHFHKPSVQAASDLGICTTVLKRLCRQFGIPRWPYRKVNAQLDFPVNTNGKTVRVKATLSETGSETAPHYVAYTPEVDKPGPTSATPPDMQLAPGQSGGSS
eukprot:jgi/Chlat1/8695/Chrsp88S09240